MAKPEAAKYDVFISHASEDKEKVARPLYGALTARGISVWLDEAELTLGDSLRRKIDEGLARCRYGVVTASPAFLWREWPQRELDGLCARETATGEKAILASEDDVRVADAARRALCSGNMDLEASVDFVRQLAKSKSQEEAAFNCVAQFPLWTNSETHDWLGPVWRDVVPGVLSRAMAVRDEKVCSAAARFAERHCVTAALNAVSAAAAKHGECARAVVHTLKAFDLCRAH